MESEYTTFEYTFMKYVAEFGKQVRKNGGSYYVALPKSWTKINGVRPGDRIRVLVANEGSLRIEAIKEAVK